MKAKSLTDYKMDNVMGRNMHFMVFLRTLQRLCQTGVNSPVSPVWADLRNVFPEPIVKR